MSPAPRVVHLSLSPTPGSFYPQSLRVLLAGVLGRTVVAHLGPGDLRQFYVGQGALRRAWIRVTLAQLDSAVGPDGEGVEDMGGFVRSPSDPVSFFDAHANYYADLAAADPAFAERYRVLGEMLASRAAPAKGALALDLGAGDGTLSLACAAAGYEVVAIDGSRAMLGIAARRFADAGASVRTLQAMLPLDSRTAHEFAGRATLIVASSVIEYVADDEALVRQCAALLAPGGTLVVSFPNAHSLPRALQRRLARIRRRHAGVRRRLYTPEHVREMAASSGLVLDKLAYLEVHVAALRRVLGERRPRHAAALFAGAFRKASA